jgi:hypothetical protein
VTSSSAQGSYSITSSDTVTIDTGVIAQDISLVYPDVITLSGSNDNAIDSSVFSNISNLDITWLSGGSGGSGYTATSSPWITTVPFENEFPDWDSVQQMCQKYPGLKIAFEKFKTSYYLVKDDWEQKQRKQK